MSITVQNLTKRYGQFTALDNVSLEAKSSNLTALLGPSGSGKTTLLRIIAGLEVPDSGAILYRDDDITDRSARDRNIGFVFQHYALFRHMTVFENVAFGLRVRNWPNEKVRSRVDELLHLIRLDGLGNRYPSQLSGGQRQRVALARALAPQPHILLLDEPFGALDAKVRQELRAALRRLHDELRVTSIFVTHDQEEAFEVADEVVVMNQGKVEQAGPPQDVFEHPANDFVMDFLGNVNVFPNRGEGESTAQAYVRPQDLELDRQAPGFPCLSAKIVHINPTGKAQKVRLMVEEYGLALNVHLPPLRGEELNLQVGEFVFLYPRRNQGA